MIIFISIFLVFTSDSIVKFFHFLVTKTYIKKAKNKLDKEIELPKATLTSTAFFHYRMAKAFPGTRGLQWINNPKKALDRLEILLKAPISFEADFGEYESDPIWWFRGGSALQIRTFGRIGRKKALINIDQLKIKRIAAYHADLYYKDFVYVETEGEGQTGLYDFKNEDIERHIKSRGYSWEEYGIIKNRLGWSTLIRREEYEDGATLRRGKVINAENAKLRVRYITKYNFIIAAKGSPYNSNRFDLESKLYFNDILNGRNNQKNSSSD